MDVLGKRYPSVIRIVRRLRGGSQPILVEADDGMLYVVKFGNNLQGPNVLFNEFMGSELYRTLGLSVPDWTTLFVADSFIARNPECRFATESDYLKPVSGPCFGSRFLNPPLREILPQGWYGRVRNRKDFWLAWMVDICASHTDNRQVVFRHYKDSELNAYFLDHGHMFGGPKGESRQHFVASRYLDPRIYPDISAQFLARLGRISRRLDTDRLWRRTKMLPEEWLTPSALGQFAECLARLQDSRLLKSVLDTILDFQHQLDARTRDRERLLAHGTENVNVSTALRRAGSYQKIAEGVVA